MLIKTPKKNTILTMVDPKLIEQRLSKDRTDAERLTTSGFLAFEMLTGTSPSETKGATCSAIVYQSVPKDKKTRKGVFYIPQGTLPNYICIISQYFPTKSIKSDDNTTIMEIHGFIDSKTIMANESERIKDVNGYKFIRIDEEELISPYAFVIERPEMFNLTKAEVLV